MHACVTPAYLRAYLPVHRDLWARLLGGAGTGPQVASRAGVGPAAQPRPAAATRTCTQCGSLLKPNYRFCNICGLKLDPASALPSATFPSAHSFASSVSSPRSSTEASQAASIGASRGLDPAVLAHKDPRHEVADPRFALEEQPTYWGLGGNGEGGLDSAELSSSSELLYPDHRHTAPAVTDPRFALEEQPMSWNLGTNGQGDQTRMIGEEGNQEPAYVRVHLNLPLAAAGEEGSARRAHFEADVTQVLSNVCAVDELRFEMVDVNYHVAPEKDTLIIVCIHPPGTDDTVVTTPSSRASAHALASLLQQNFENHDSQFFLGTYTRHASTFEIMDEHEVLHWLHHTAPADDEACGVGMNLHENSLGEMEVVGLQDGRAAERSFAIRLHDVLLAVDGVNVYQWPFDHVRPLILGPPGSTVSLRLRRFVQWQGTKTIMPVQVTLMRSPGPVHLQQALSPAETQGVNTKDAQVTRADDDGWPQLKPTSPPVNDNSDCAENEGGVGLCLLENDIGELVVVNLEPGSVSDRSFAIHMNDTLHGVDGVNVYRWPMERVIPLIRGPLGSSVRLHFKRFVNWNDAMIGIDVVLVRSRTELFGTPPVSPRHSTDSDSDPAPTQRRALLPDPTISSPTFAAPPQLRVRAKMPTVASPGQENLRDKAADSGHKDHAEVLPLVPLPRRSSITRTPASGSSFASGRKGNNRDIAGAGGHIVDRPQQSGDLTTKEAARASALVKSASFLVNSAGNTGADFDCFQTRQGSVLLVNSAGNTGADLDGDIAEREIAELEFLLRQRKLSNRV